MNKHVDNLIKESTVNTFYEMGVTSHFDKYRFCELIIRDIETIIKENPNDPVNLISTIRAIYGQRVG